MDKLEKVYKYTRWIPLVLFVLTNLLLALVFILGSLHYDYIRWQGWSYGSYIHKTTPYNFYSCAFEYDSTLVAFIFMIINANLITVADVAGAIQLSKKTVNLGSAIFNIVFSFIYFTTSLIMSIFLAACCEIDSGIPMYVTAFLQTFLIFAPFAYGVFCLVAYILLKKKASKTNMEATPIPNKEKTKADNGWYCPECGKHNTTEFCDECGTKKP